MTFPGGIALTTVKTDYFAQSGTADPIEASGTVSFTPGADPDHPIYINVTGAGIFVPFPVTGTVDGVTGIMSVDLIPANATGVEPQDFTYHMKEDVTVTSGTQTVHFDREFDISVPESVDPILLSDIAPTVPSSGSITYVRSVNGVNPDATGALTLTAAEIGAYVKPVGGIPESDMTAAVQAKLDAAGAAGTVTQVNGVSPDGLGHVILIPSDISAASASDLSTEITRAEAAEAALYTKPALGIPKTDMTASVQTSLSSADSAVQPTRQVIAGTGLAGGGTLAADRTISANVGTTTGTLAAGDDSRIVGAEQVANKNAAGGYVGIDATTGRALPSKLPLVPQIQSVAFASTITFDASTGNEVRIGALTGNLTLANPTNPTDGQLLLFVLPQDATGGRTLTLGSAFDLGTNTVTLSTAPNKVDFLLCKYIAALTKWCVLAFAPGY